MFRDFYKWLFCNQNDEFAFAIEPEISRKFFESMMYYEDHKNESDTIVELLNVHKRDESWRMEIYDEVHNYYKDKFPLWSDRRISWGVHFILFWDFEYFRDYWRELRHKLLNCPLFLKIYNWSMYSRYLGQYAEFAGNYLPTWSKWYYACIKDELYSHHESVQGRPIEFRCNNVFDDRILWYYQWVLLAIKYWVKFKKLTNEFKKYAMTWDSNTYNTMDVHCRELLWYTISKEEMKILRHNIKKILKLLIDNNLTESAKQLKEYCNEYWIKYI